MAVRRPARPVAKKPPARKPVALAFDIVVEAGDWPGPRTLKGHVATALAAACRRIRPPQGAELAVTFTNDAHIRVLNRQFRRKDKPTNVLSFPMLEREDLLDLPAEGPPELLGDIALALETCTHEAAAKGLALEHHAAHLIVHGLLHLAGHDHEISPEDARAMEIVEIKALALLGIADPYGDH